MKILVLGATGMLGNMVFRYFQNNELFETWGTIRSEKALSCFPVHFHPKLITNVDVLVHDELISVLGKIQPDYVINCVGLIKQQARAHDPLAVLPVNSLFPHQLSRLCSLISSRLIHISTDCVFSGEKGGYVESDPSDAHDLYGKSKCIGEVIDSPHAVTLRTSIIGHELNSNYALVDWFLAQEGRVKGYKKAIFSGLPTVELARVIRDYVIPNTHLSGLYHVAAKPVNKCHLLTLIAEQYNKNILIEPDEQVTIDRSLNGTRFEKQTGYRAPDWPILIKNMHELHNTGVL